MDQDQRNAVKNKILKRYELYKLQHSRMRRVLKDPFRTIPYYIIQIFAHKYPFKINYRTLWGDKMSFYLPEGNSIYYYGFFEANLTNFFLNVLQKDDIFIDIGAHVGYYTVLASALIGKNGQVHSFEPTPRTYKTLEKNVQIRKNITVNNNAILDKEKIIDFIDYGPKYSVFNSFKERTGEEMTFLKTSQKFSVKTVSIDSYCINENIIPTFIKIDAEGSEHLVLESMNKTLKEFKPIVTIEVGGNEEWEENCKKSIQILRKNGFLIYEIDNYGYLHKHEQKETYAYDNLVFIHPDKKKKVKKLIK